MRYRTATKIHEDPMCRSSFYDVATCSRRNSSRVGCDDPQGLGRSRLVRLRRALGNSVLADWDAWRPDVSDTQGERARSSVPECEQCRLVRASIALREHTTAAGQAALSALAVIKTAAVAVNLATALPDTPRSGLQNEGMQAFEPIELGHDFYAGIAFELNRNAEGIDLSQPPTPPVKVQAASKTVRTAQASERDLPDVVWASLEPIVRGRNEYADHRPNAGGNGPSLAIIAEKSISAVVTPPHVPLLTAPSDASQSVAQNEPQPKNLADGIPWPTFAPGEPTVQPPAQVVHQAIPWPVFAPVESTRGSDIAHATGPLREHAVASAAPKCTSSSVHAWGRAADLTRQAMRAWLDVLVGSKPVEMTARY